MKKKICALFFISLFMLLSSTALADWQSGVNFRGTMMVGEGSTAFSLITSFRPMLYQPLSDYSKVIPSRHGPSIGVGALGLSTFTENEDGSNSSLGAILPIASLGYVFHTSSERERCCCSRSYGRSFNLAGDFGLYFLVGPKAIGAEAALNFSIPLDSVKEAAGESGHLTFGPGLLFLQTKYELEGKRVEEVFFVFNYGGLYIL